MKYIKLFDTTANMNAAIANSTVGFIGMADNNGNPVLNNVKVTPGPGPTPPTPSYSTPFYVENITQDDETLSIICVNELSYGLDHPFTVEYSTNGTTWNTLGTIDIEEPLTIELNPNDKIYLRAETVGWCERSTGSYAYINGVSKVGGNIMSLLYGSNFTGNERSFPNESWFNFRGLFYGNTDLVNASELLLPATTLTESCYCDMFDGCTSLTSAPALPATTLTNYCYDRMFNGCSSLTSAPVLPATTLEFYCYHAMFGGCNNLNYIKCLATDTSTSGCTDMWVYDVSASGTFVKNPNMTSWTTGADGIPEGWTVENATD